MTRSEPFSCAGPLIGGHPTRRSDQIPVTGSGYGPSGTPIEQVDLATGATTYLIADALGSVRDAVAADGSVIASTSYDAWGNAPAAGDRHPAGELNPSVTFSITADGRPFSGLQVSLTA